MSNNQSSPEIDYEKLISVIPEIKPGCVIALKVGGMSLMQLENFTKGIADAVRSRNIFPVTLIPLDNGQEIDVLDEEKMRKAGWVRCQTQANGYVDNIKKVVNDLVDNNVYLNVEIESIGGCRTIRLNREQVFDYMQDPVLFKAKYYGVTKQQFIDWCASNYTVQCSGITKKGRRCRCSVPGGSMVDPAVWVSLQGEYCDIHQ